jgi:hypothetical protein
MGEDALIRLTNLKALGHGPADLVRLIGSTYPYWRDLLAGQKSFGEKAARNIEAKLGLPRGCLDQPDGCLRSSVRVGEPPATYTVTHPDDDHLIPQYAAGGAMGHGLILEENPPGLIKGWRVDHEWLRLNVRHHTGIQNLCIVTGFGPSMRGMFNPGDPLLCDRGVKVVDVDAVYFFRIADHGFIKMLQRIPTAEGIVIRAKSKNPDYDPFDITDKMDFEVFGRILTVWKSEQL